MSSLAETNGSVALHVPRGWYLAGSVREISRQPQSVFVGAQEYVAFMPVGGTPAVIDGVCIHMGARLSLGCVVGERLQCPFHQWEFNGAGQCQKIPALAKVPAFARQRAYPTVTRDGFVFFFNDVSPPFELPFFDDKPEGVLRAAQPFTFEINAPWYMIGANGFDLQHFRAAHDRTLIDEPVVSEHGPYCRQISARFKVTGAGIRDGLTRFASGPEVFMTIRSWAGVMILISAKFQRTTSYGMVCVRPVSAGQTRATTIVWIDRRANVIARAMIDPLDAWIRRSFIRAFLRSDIDRSPGIRYVPGTLIEADRVLGDYLEWVLSLVSAFPHEVRR